jgi:hypothetical protein
MKKTSFRFLVFLFTVSVCLFFFAKLSTAQDNASESEVIERLSEIKNMLAHERQSDHRWWYGWLGAYSAATIAQGGVWIAARDLDTRQDMALGAATTFLGAAGQMISPLRPNHEWQRIGQMPESTPDEKRIKLRDAEKLLQQNAVNERIGRSFKTHAVSTVVNMGSGLVTWLGFKRSFWAGLGNFALNEAITETQIFTQPRRAMRDYERYLNTYKFSPSKSTPVAITINMYPGGMALMVRF